MNCRRGEIVLLLFPDSNPHTSKRRPALPQTIVAMIASNMLGAGLPSRMTVKIGSENAKRSGLLTDSAIMTDNLATVRYAEIDRVIGTFPDLTEFEAALRATLAL